MPSSQTSLSNSNDSASKMFQASTSNCNYVGELNENLNWYSDSVTGTELNRPGPQNEWWTEFMAEDWKEILNDEDVSVATHSQPLVTGEVVQVQVPAELAESQPRLSIIPQLTSQQTHAKNPTNQNSGKPRMRWTQELHERFIDAVNKLGGSDKATPKAVLKIMKVDDLTIYHVKSHLQKYRTARYRPDLPEDTGVEGSQSQEVLPAIDLKSSLNLTEALRLQLELQKKLHEQLEIQRNLQIKIEEQGKYLQSLIEQQQGNPNSPTVTENGDKTQNEGNPKSENEI